MSLKHHILRFLYFVNDSVTQEKRRVSSSCRYKYRDYESINGKALGEQIDFHYIFNCAKSCKCSGLITTNFSKNVHIPAAFPKASSDVLHNKESVQKFQFKKFAYEGRQ